ncbi:alpha/beta hydrolase fold domain-containing protein [Nocardioides sp. CFH 31398]|uniref:alpha/beta hydrolase fold domain-containing protein n=1 Tax=Nocardioides sp. CFH 31398 TaxID=2919579 RepID=UPI001F06DE8F|nr:alpha/beta hydrolase fold domain-containing protein [Nocardioides sp. CFH 31398]MCH1865630.1 alpha/beta hydrolase [Nocardioides sp. CFH 31398]
MAVGDWLKAFVIHHSAPFTVRYGSDLQFAGIDLPAPRRRRLATRHGKVGVLEHGEPGAPAYVHVHGGAWLMRYPMMDDWWCRYVAATAGVRVVNVDFDAGPYVRYPVAQEQCHDVAAAVAAEAPVAIGGFSSGGGTAAAVALMARDTGSFTPRLQVLGVPALDMHSDPAAQGDAGMISLRLRRLVRRVYFPDVASRREPYASPLLAEDLTGLPPAVVLTAERDSLRPDGDAYARRLAEAGVRVWHDVTPGVDHYFLTEDPARARSTMAKTSDEIRRALS